METINLPTIKPREYQMPLWDILANGYRRGIFLWARRHGKDVTLWNFIFVQAIQTRGLYFYLLPTYKQAKRVIWDGMTNDGRRFIDLIPRELIKNINKTDLSFELINGSIVQLIGTDNFDSVRGSNPVGVVLSEYAYHNPIVWDAVLKPILKMNGGWAIFNSTPNKHAPKNHFYDLWQMALKNEKWFTHKVSVNDTGLLSPDDIEEERKEGMSEESIQIEYYCNFNVATTGVIFSRQIQKAREENRVTELSYNPVLPVEVFFDIGRSDYTVMLFAQRKGESIRIIDCEYSNGHEASYYIDLLEKKGYRYSKIWLPHDAYHKRIEARYSVAEQFQELYGDKVEKAKEMSIQNGLNRVRALFGRFYIDSKKCESLIKAVDNYHYEYDELKKMYRDEPYHDWSSHFCDSLRYLAVSWEDIESKDYDTAVQEYLRSTAKSPLQQELENNLSQNFEIMLESHQNNGGNNPFSFQ